MRATRKKFRDFRRISFVVFVPRVFSAVGSVAWEFAVVTSVAESNRRSSPLRAEWSVETFGACVVGGFKRGFGGNCLKRDKVFSISKMCRFQSLL